MKKITIIAAAMMLTPGLVLASHNHNRHDNVFYDKARVIKAEPIVRHVRVSTPQRECYTEEVRQPVYKRGGGDPGATLVGGVIGGVVGNKLGHGRKGATIAGTLIGAAIGNQSTRKHEEYYEEVNYVDRCEVRRSYHTEERVDGYRVSYRYKGEVYRTRMPYDPGKFIRVRVNVSPAFDD